MGTILIIFTKRRFNPISWLIRVVLPRSLFSPAISSHCLIIDGDYAIEANMLHGVRRVPFAVAMKGLTPVKAVTYAVPDHLGGLEWARNQVGCRYDWEGILGLAISPGRDWQEPGKWFCYELAAATIVNAGRDAFAGKGHITEATLLSIKP